MKGLTLVSLGCLDGGGENGNQFVSFLTQICESSWCNDFTFGQQLQPVGCLIQLLKCALHFADELGGGT
jgi:hypothetical protein